MGFEKPSYVFGAPRKNFALSRLHQGVQGLCFEVQNSQRSVEALGRQFAHAMGVPSIPRFRTPKIMDSLVGPGKANMTVEQGTGGPAIYLSSGILHRTARRKSISPSKGGHMVSKNEESSTYQLPSGSLKPRMCHWLHMSDLPKASYKFRITLMFHEIQDFPEIVLDELDIEAQYRMVEHVHRMAVAEPVQLGEIEVEEKNGVKVMKPFILCPVRHVRMHYIAATEEALIAHMTKTKVDGDFEQAFLTELYKISKEENGCKGGKEIWETEVS